MKKYPHLASRIFETPLMISQAKLDVILAVTGPRLGISIDSSALAETADVHIRAMPLVENSDERDSAQAAEGIAVIDVFGPLVKRASGDFMSGGPTTYTEIEEAFTDSVTDPSIRGILFNFDSPGGEVGGLFDLAELVYSCRGQKPCYASVNDDAYSAAYALASACDKIFITQVGGVGSIGVVACHVDQSAFDEKVGVKYTYISAGARKTDFNPHEALSEAAQSSLQDEIDRLYDLFCSTVARNRRMSVESVQKTEAGIFFGPNGISAGLADQVGTCQDAINALAAATSPKTFRVASATSPQPEKNMITETKQAENEPKPAEEQTQSGGTSQSETQDPAVEQQPAAEKGAAEIKAEVAGMVAAAKEEQRNELAAIVEWCASQNKLGMAADMIRAGTTLESAKTQILEAKAADDAKIEIDSHAPFGGSPTMESLKEKASSVSKEKGISQAAAMVELVTRNPKLYEQYLAESRAIQTK